VKGKTPIFSKALKTLTSARSLLPAGRPIVCINFTNSSLHSDHHSVIKEIARHHRRCSNRSENRMSLGDISNGSNVSRTQNSFAFGNTYSQDCEINMGMNPNNKMPLAQFAYIITRPTSYLKDGRSMKKVCASKSVRVRP
jgi:hypothetical protein